MWKWRQWNLAACLLGGHVLVASAGVAVQPPGLTQADADAWLDGFMPFALARDNIAGAVVVVVKDGQVLTFFSAAILLWLAFALHLINTGAGY